MDEELCLLPVGETGRVLDRLLLLEQVIGPAAGPASLGGYRMLRLPPLFT